MSSAQDSSVIAYRIERLRKGPRNWIYWVALFTAMNGLFLAFQQDIVIPAGLVSAFALPHYSTHWLAAAALAAIAYFSRKANRLVLVGLAIYLLDTLFAVYLRIWVGVVMHLVVFGFMALALNGARLLAKQQKQEIVQD